MYVAQLYVHGVDEPLYRAAVYGINLPDPVPAETIGIEFVALASLRVSDPATALRLARRYAGQHAARTRSPWGDRHGPPIELDVG